MTFALVLWTAGNLNCFAEDLKRPNFVVAMPVSLKADTRPWHLFLGATGEVGRPVSAFFHLYASNANASAVLRISTPRDLNKLSGLHITTPSNALSFVRLLTERQTFKMFDKPWMVESHVEPSVTAVTNGFVIHRQVVEIPSIHHRRYALVMIEEFVGHDGAYKMLTRRPKGKITREKLVGAGLWEG